MSLQMDPPRNPVPAITQALAESALHRQGLLLGDRGASVPPAQAQTSPPAAHPQVPALPVPLPEMAARVSLSAQARSMAGAEWAPDPSSANPANTVRGGGAAAQGSRGPALPVTARMPATMPGAHLGSNMSAAAAALAPAAARAVLAQTPWPAGGVAPALRAWVDALVSQLSGGASPLRVVAVQAWPADQARALESGALGDDLPPLQTWLVRQGTVHTPDGPRGVAVTLRVPVPWLASQPAAPVGAPPGALLLPFAGESQALQSCVFALVLQGDEPQGGRTSALLVVDYQPLPPPVVYGRDMLQARLDPWTQMAVLQASGQVPREDERARNGASGLCETVGCPYAARAACVQPFCLAQRGVLPPETVGPVPPV